MDFGDESQGSDVQRNRQSYHRHTPSQIQRLEAVFKECPHPDENQRVGLSRELGLETRQIKFWFQNRRTQMKTQNERMDNSLLRAENDKIRRDIIAMREAIKKAICPNCGSPPVGEDFFDMQKLRMENAGLKEELERMSTLSSKRLGRPLTQMSQMPVAPLDLPVGGMSGGPALGQPSPDLDLPGGSSSGMYQSGLPLQMPAPAMEMERPVMINAASRALEELIRLAQAGDHIWVKGPPGDHWETLNAATYDSLFSRPGAGFRPQNINVEGSRDTGNVFMSAIALVEVFMDTNKWMEFFPGIVSRAHTVDVLVDGSNESLIMMHEKLHVLTPLVPTREFSFLRYCKQLEQGLWAVVDVSMDGQRGAHYGVPPSRSRRLPSGCIITDMPNGYSKVTWVEHVEIQEMLPINMLFGNLVLSGAAYGAHKWLAALQRACDRFASLGVPHDDPSGVTAEARRSMMKLTQRMMSSFCANLTSSPVKQWTLLPGNTDVSFRVFTLPSGVVIGAATSFWMPVLCDNVFAFLSNVNMRSQWDVLAHGHPVQELTRITNGTDPGNYISLLQGLNSSQNSVLMLQESCTDASGSLLVYSPIDIPAANVVMNGEDPTNILLLPSGIVILPDVRPGAGAAGAGGFSSAAPQPGCVVTVAIQILVSSLPVPNVDAESVGIANNIITSTVQQIRAALNCTVPLT